MIKYLRRTWQIRTGRYETPFDGGTPIWMVSLMLHLVAILIIAKLLMPSLTDDDISLTSDFTPNELIEVADLELNDMTLEESELVQIDEAEIEFDEIVIETPVMSLDNEMPDAFDAVVSENGTLALGAENGGEGMVTVSEEHTAKGVAGASVSSASGAVDRISQEIIRSLDNNKTLVVWIFDASISLLEQRTSIQNRLENVYFDLSTAGVLNDDSPEQLKDFELITDVIAFGQSVSPMLERPTGDVEQVKNAISKIARDDSGVENVMTAVMLAANEYKNLHKVDSSTGKRKRDVMLIVVTDEAGDDGKLTDQAVKVCRANQMPVFVIGVPAPFGRNETEVKWVDPDPQYDQSPQVALVNQGPESMMPERLRMDFTGDFEDLEMIDSGFGPFDLTKLCYETGGIYFAVHPNRGKSSLEWDEVSNYASYLRHFFDADVMKPYRPDYVSQLDYQKLLSRSQMRTALVKAASYTSTGTLKRPRLRFSKFDEARFVTDVTRAQRAAAIVEPKINQLYEMLKVGEKDRPKEEAPRWQAGYDLAMGRVMAAKVRAETYNMMLALAKTKLQFDKPKSKDEKQNNTWTLRPANTIETGSQGEKLAEKARAYLQRVIADHPDTPWALIAERELQTPIGWTWEQSYRTPPGERMNNGNNNPRPEKEMKNENRPKKRAVPKL